MSKINLEEFLKDLKKTFEQLKFIDEQRVSDFDRCGEGILIGIQLCIKELERRLEDI